MHPSYSACSCAVSWVFTVSIVTSETALSLTTRLLRSLGAATVHYTPVALDGKARFGVAALSRRSHNDLRQLAYTGYRVNGRDRMEYYLTPLALFNDQKPAHTRASRRRSAARELQATLLENCSLKARPLTSLFPECCGSAFIVELQA